MCVLGSHCQALSLRALDCSSEDNEKYKPYLHRLPSLCERRWPNVGESCPPAHSLVLQNTLLGFTVGRGLDLGYRSGCPTNEDTELCWASQVSERKNRGTRIYNPGIHQETLKDHKFKVIFSYILSSGSVWAM